MKLGEPPIIPRPISHGKNYNLPWKELYESCNKQLSTKFETQYQLLAYMLEFYNENIADVAAFFGISYSAIRSKLINKGLWSPNTLGVTGKTRMQKLGRKTVANMTGAELSVLLGMQPRSARRLAWRLKYKYRKVNRSEK